MLVIMYLLIALLYASFLAYNATEEASSPLRREVLEYDKYAVIAILFTMCLCWPFVLTWKMFKK